jgi:molybdate transport system substrate-binding protein
MSYFKKIISGRLLKLCLVIIFCFAGEYIFAQPLRIAVAANAQGVIKKLQADFKMRTGIETQVIVGSSGKLTTQIMNGAPYDVFLSADFRFPQTLFAQGFGIRKPVVYALGSLILCANTPEDLNNWQVLLKGKRAKKIAIANPESAPYGKAAKQTLQHYKLLDNVYSNLVYGESVAQVNTYIQKGVVTFGFTTEAFLYEAKRNPNLKWVRIDQNSYEIISQGAILLTFARNGKLEQATKFFEYLTSVAARKIIGRSGYRLPKKSKT